jgi:hypothetical protein
MESILFSSLHDPSSKWKLSLKSGKLCGLIADSVEVECCEFQLDIPDPFVCQKVVDYLIYHGETPSKPITKPIGMKTMKDLVGEWDATFMDLDVDLVVEMILVSSYLSCSGLFELATVKLATMVRNKDLDEVKDMFHIARDITPEEEKQVREANLWVYDLLNMFT